MLFLSGSIVLSTGTIGTVRKRVNNMNDKKLLEQLRNQLADIQETTHDTLEPSITRKIEEAIENLDLIIEDSASKEKDYKSIGLKVLGDLIIYFPSIVEIIRIFSKFSE